MNAVSSYTGRPKPGSTEQGAGSMGPVAKIQAPADMNSATGRTLQPMVIHETFIVPQARDRWLSATVRNYTPDTIGGILQSAFSGNLIEQWRLFDLMEQTWPHLNKDLNELKRAVRSMQWSFTPFAEENQKPTDSAKEKAAFVSKALRGMKPRPQSDENNFFATIYDVMDAWGKGIAVLEIDWMMGFGGLAIVPRCTRWIHPRYYGYPTTANELMLNTTQVNLRMGIVPADAVQLQPTLEYFAPFPENKFLIAISKNKSGHPIGGALLRTLAWWWCAANFTAEWFLNFAQIFGQPFRWATYDPAKPNLKDQVADMMENMGSAAWAVFPEGTKLELKEASKNSSENPQAFMLRFADKIADIMILGQTLSTDVGDSGSRALGQVHEGVRADVMQAVAEWVGEILNNQLIPAICVLNYGTAEESPVAQPSSRESKDALALAQRDKILLSIDGVEISKNHFYERHDLPMPEPGDDVIVGSAKSSQGSTESRPTVESKDATAELTDRVLEDLSGVQAKWLGGLKPFFARLVEAAGNDKLTDAEFVQAIERAKNQFPELFKNLNREVLAKSLEDAMGAACVNGAVTGAMRRGTARKEAHAHR